MLTLIQILEDGATVSDPIPAQQVLGDLSEAHRDLRTLLERLTNNEHDRLALAEEMRDAMAKHRAICTDGVMDRAAHTPENHEQATRLLAAATDGIEQIVERLRSPARDDHVIATLLEALRTFLLQHERLELELALAGLDDGPEAAPGAPGVV